MSDKQFMKTFSMLFSITSGQSIAQAEVILKNGLLGITETTLTLTNGDSFEDALGETSDEVVVPLYDVGELSKSNFTVRFFIKSSKRQCTLEFKSSEEAENFLKIFAILTRDGFDDPRFDHDREKHFSETLGALGSKAYITNGVIVATVVYFVVELLSGGTASTLDSRIAIDLGANFGLETLNGGWWRLFSSMFIHFGIFHLVLNMISLYAVGGYVEKLYGSRHFLFIYLLSGLSGSALSLFMNPTVVSAGASGAVFGVYGAFIVFATRKSLGVPVSIAKTLLGSAIPFVAYNLFYGFTAKGSGVDNWAHIGGLFGGLFTGFVMAREISLNRKPGEIRHFLSTALASSAVVGVVVLLVFFVKGTYDGATVKVLGEYADNKANVAFTAGKFSDALVWFDKGAKRANAHSIYALGYMYLNGKGVPKDDQVGLSYYRQAADLGSADAQFGLGMMYDYGKGVAKDSKEAVKWYHLAADQGNSSAQYNLADMYYNGQGVQQDFKEAVKWFRLAADQGVTGAQNGLGQRYRWGQGVTQDYKEAMRLFRSAADQGDPSAQTNIGLMYYLSQGVTQDYKEAVKWFRLAADQGTADAQTDLGMMYAKGQGVPQDYKEAVKWYRLAAEQGDVFALNNLASMYENGLGVPSNRVLAYGLYNLSASAASYQKKEIEANFTKLAASMSNSEVDEAKSLTSEMSKPGQLLVAMDQYLNNIAVK